MSASKSERVLNLLVALLTTNRYLTKQELREMVDGYRDVKSFDRTFERDKDELRQLGVPLETGSNDPSQEEHDGYRINRRDFELPEIEFTADERLAIGLAAHAWQSSIGADATAEALKRLRAAGAAPDVGRLPQILAHIPVTERAFDDVYQALFSRREIRFAYDDKPRRVQPWRLYQRRGQWLVLGWDLDREAPRRFKLNRIDGEVQAVGEDGAYDIPDDVSMLLESPATATAIVAIADAPELLAGAEPVEWDGALPAGFSAHEVSRLNERMIIDDVVVAGPDAFVLAPDGIRSRVIERLRGLRDAHFVRSSAIKSAAPERGAQDPEEDAEAGAQVPEENAQAGGQVPEEDAEAGGQVPEEDAQSGGQVPEEDARGGDQVPEEDARGGDQVPEEDAQAGDQVPEEDAQHPSRRARKEDV